MAIALTRSVYIIRSGPVGLLLSQLRASSDIDNVVIVRKDRVYVEARVRAGILEQARSMR